MERAMEFYNSEGKPARTNKLNSLAQCVTENSKGIRSLETAVGNISPSGAPGDPGDMIAWFDNGLI